MSARNTALSTQLSILLFVFGCFSTAGAAPTDPQEHSAPGTYIWVGNHRLHIHCIGEGSPTVVFDSGLGGTALDWSRVQPEVARFTRACAYDRAGYGWSDPGPWPRNSEKIVCELDKLLGFAGVAPPYILVGHSFGGLNVRLFANLHPERVAGLVLVDSSHEDQFRLFEEAGLRSPVPRGGTFFVRNQQQIPDGLPREQQSLAQAFAQSHDTAVSLQSELRYFRASARRVGAARTLPDVPLVVITHNTYGEFDQPPARLMAGLWLQMQQELADRTLGGRMVVAETNEHYIHLYEPDLVVNAIQSVVDTNRDHRACNPAAGKGDCLAARIP